MSDKVEVPKSDFKDLDNLAECVCGNWTHQHYIRYDDDMNGSCPECMFEYLTEQVIKMKQLAIEIADPELSKEDVTNMIREKYCKIYGIDFNGADTDFFESIGI